MFDMKKVGERLKEERARLALTRQKLVTLRVSLRPPTPNTSLASAPPPLRRWMDFIELGMDIGYLLAGERPSLGTEAPLTANERAWLQHYRDAKDKTTLFKLAAAFNSL